MARCKASPARKPSSYWSTKRAAVRTCNRDTATIVRLSVPSRVNSANASALCAALICPVRSLIERAEENSVATQSLIASSSTSCWPSQLCIRWVSVSLVTPQRVAKYPGRASIPVFVAHPTDEVTRGLRLDRHRIGHRLQRRHVDTLARSIDRGDLRDGLAASRDAHRLAGGGAFDQFAQMRLRVGETNCYHPALLTNYLVTHTTGFQRHARAPRYRRDPVAGLGAERGPGADPVAGGCGGGVAAIRLGAAVPDVPARQRGVPTAEPRGRRAAECHRG